MDLLGTVLPATVHTHLDRGPISSILPLRNLVIEASNGLSSVILMYCVSACFVRGCGVNKIIIANHSSQWVAYPSFICVVLINI